MINENYTAQFVTYIYNESIQLRNNLIFMAANNVTQITDNIIMNPSDSTEEMLIQVPTVGVVIVNSSVVTGTIPPTTTSTKNATKTSSSADSNYQNSVIIPLYAVIFGCCVIGNLLVILTLAQNKRMRTVTNVYLLNLVNNLLFLFNNINNIYLL